MARYQVLQWKDIPSQVRVVDDTGAIVTRALPADFQERIDQEAMRLGLYGTEDYLEQWAWSPERERPGEAEAVATALVEELIAGSA